MADIDTILQFLYDRTQRFAQGVKVTFPDEGEWKKDEEEINKKGQTK